MLGLTVWFHFLKNTDINFRLFLTEFVVGAVVTPMLFAVVSVIHAIVHESKVYDYIYYCLGFLGIIALLRLAAYFAIAGINVQIATVAAVVAVLSIFIFVVWDFLFAVTDHFMKKGPRKKKRR